MAGPKVAKVNGIWKVVTEQEYQEIQTAQALMAGEVDQYQTADQALLAGMSPGLKASIGGSFTIANEAPQHRLVVAVDGLEKQGKSHFALTAPGPIAYQGTDIGLEGVVHKFQSTKQVFLAEYGFSIDKGDTPQQIIAKVEPEWTRFLKDYLDAVIPGLKTKAIRTGIWDTGSELWEFLRLARLGKLTQVMPHHYTGLNQEYSQLIKQIYNTPGNLIILHKLKAEWKDNPTTGKGNKTGAWERSGFAGTGFLVQVNVTAWRDQEGTFHITVKDCRQNPAIVGLDLYGEMATFPWLAVNVYPHTSLEDWM